MCSLETSKLHVIARHWNKVTDYLIHHTYEKGTQHSRSTTYENTCVSAELSSCWL